MENASLVGLSRQVALRRELDVISNNVANMNTSGFKAEEMTFGEYLMPKARDDTFQRRDRTLSFVEDLATWHDQTAGAIQTTGADTDVAIDGEGFFVVEGAGGTRYTRNGAFQINSQGVLVTSEGARVLSTSGPIQLGPNERGLTISSDGTISTNEGVRGKLRVARFSSLQDLSKEGASLFRSDAEPQEATARVRIVQGAIEKSNVKPVAEMSRLVEVTRAYESVTSLLSKQDEIRRAAIEKLAEVPS
ncbi:flagellar basal-body rod protein FlgF [Chenggangzhangella methanolivorans]|uniref:Flagellar basal-body rod protein FlgF n=1 Tax=Chenggangzhangella methanolivorans TaxID=1437009 RepID=A0A9E6ULV9_9HYPH|nr:flagellar basal-body rod protein FlgF [Chenggangzhangella methanolivorans]QZO00992.1 flagellar basal-body rod protein FlgF [Chenggangzhangella methanolivorans]